MLQVRCPWGLVGSCSPAGSGDRGERRHGRRGEKRDGVGTRGQKTKGQGKERKRVREEMGGRVGRLPVLGLKQETLEAEEPGSDGCRSRTVESMRVITRRLGFPAGSRCSVITPASPSNTPRGRASPQWPSWQRPPPACPRLISLPAPRLCHFPHASDLCAGSGSGRGR